jgi:RHS repeat-associated protein
VGRVQYNPYGEVLTSTLPVDLTDRLFTGQRLDSSSGLYYYNARYYDPHLGRFIQPDTLVPDPLNPQAWNRFSYCYNNPTSYVDPNGQFAVPAILLVAAVGFLAGEIYAGTQGYTPRDVEFWYYSGGGAVAATSLYFLAADVAIVAGLGLQQAGLWTGSTTAFGWGLAWTSAGGGMYAWAFQPLNFSRLPLGVSPAKPTDAPAIREFGRRAESVQEARNQRSFSSLWWDFFAEQIEGGATEGWFVHRSGEEITGMMKIAPGRGMLEVKWLEGLGGGAGTRLMQAAVMQSMARGYGGAIYLHSAEQAIPFYQKLGPSLFDPAQENLFMWNVRAALALLLR